MINILYTQNDNVLFVSTVIRIRERAKYILVTISNSLTIFNNSQKNINININKYYIVLILTKVRIE